MALPPPTLALSKTGTVHLIREDGRTSCGREIDHEKGWLYTNADEGVRSVCYQCEHHLRRWAPSVEFICTECRERLSREDWAWLNHWHVEKKHPTPASDDRNPQEAP